VTAAVGRARQARRNTSPGWGREPMRDCANAADDLVWTVIRSGEAQEVETPDSSERLPPSKPLSSSLAPRSAASVSPSAHRLSRGQSSSKEARCFWRFYTRSAESAISRGLGTCNGNSLVWQCLRPASQLWCRPSRRPALASSSRVARVRGQRPAPIVKPCRRGAVVRVGSPRFQRRGSRGRPGERTFNGVSKPG